MKYGYASPEAMCGYARISTIDQTPAMQLDATQESGLPEDFLARGPAEVILRKGGEDRAPAPCFSASSTLECPETKTGAMPHRSPVMRASPNVNLSGPRRRSLLKSRRHRGSHYYFRLHLHSAVRALYCSALGQEKEA